MKLSIELPGIPSVGAHMLEAWVREEGGEWQWSPGAFERVSGRFCQLCPRRRNGRERIIHSDIQGHFEGPRAGERKGLHDRLGHVELLWLRGGGYREAHGVVVRGRERGLRGILQWWGWADVTFGASHVTRLPRLWSIPTPFHFHPKPASPPPIPSRYTTIPPDTPDKPTTLLPPPRKCLSSTSSACPSFVA